MENENMDVEIDKIAKKGMIITKGITNFKSCKNYIGSFKDQSINILQILILILNIKIFYYQYQILIIWNYAKFQNKIIMK